MSTSNQRDALDPKDLLYYAPHRLRQSDNDQPTLQPLPGESGQSELTTSREQRPCYDAALLVDAVPKALRKPYGPEPIIEPLDFVLQRARRNEVFSLASRFVVAAGIVAGVALFYVMNFTGSRDQALSTEAGGTSLSATPQAKKAAMEQLIQKMTAPTLAVEDAEGNSNEPLSLGVKVTGNTLGETVNLSGLPADTKLTTGVSSAAGEWRVAVNDLPVTVVIPPRDYVGQMNIVAELRDGNGQAVVRSPVRLIWRQPIPDPGDAVRLQTPPANASSAVSATAPGASRQMDPKEIAALIKRGEEFASSGDLPAARLLLQRVAEAHNARAAFELAATYDPLVIKRFGSNSATPDLALARAWYQRARDWGSPDAAKQLEALASAER